MTNTILTPTKLWGGAVKVAIDGRFNSLETVIDIPAHQEVFSAKNGEVLIFEINHILQCDDGQIASEYFNDYALCQSSDFSKVELILEPHGQETCPNLHQRLKEKNYSLHVCGGTQWFKNRQSTTARGVSVSICVLRLPEIDTDFVIVWNIPLPEEIPVEMYEKSAKAIGNCWEPAFLSIVDSLEIHDWSFFETPEAEQQSDLIREGLHNNGPI